MRRKVLRSGAAVLLAEYAGPRVRNVVKPILETIAGIPTIVLGFFDRHFNIIHTLLSIIDSFISLSLH